MGKHAQSGRVFRHKYPVLAASAVLAVAGVSSFLVAGGAPAISALVSGEAPATASSSGGTNHGNGQAGGGLAFLSASAAAPGRSSGGEGGFAVGSTVPRRHSNPGSFISPTITPTAARTTPSVTPTITPTVTPTARPTVTPSDTPTATPTSSPSSGSGQFFGLAPVGTQLPRSDAYCASQVQPMAENVPANATADKTVPSGAIQFGPWAQRIAYFSHVDGNFTGTTGEILEWAACKWGWNQDYAMAEAVIESTWRQSEVGGGSYGILQIKVSAGGAAPSANSGWGGYPWVQESTALNADAQMAYLRACYDGDTPWLGNGYQAGNAWGCIGSWYSGQWLSSAADGYISRVQAALSSQAWLNL
jgi:hypothetical protein